MKSAFPSGTIIGGAGRDYPHGACQACCLAFNFSWRKPSVSWKKQAKSTALAITETLPVANEFKGGRNALDVILVCF